MSVEQIQDDSHHLQFFNVINNIDTWEANPNKAYALFFGSSANELRLESFAKDEVLKHNSELPLNASEQDTPTISTNKKACLVQVFLLVWASKELNPL